MFHAWLYVLRDTPRLLHPYDEIFFWAVVVLGERDQSLLFKGRGGHPRGIPLLRGVDAPSSLF